jgi:hypothetical protein
MEDGFLYTTGFGRILGEDRDALDIVRTPSLLSFLSAVPDAISVAVWGDVSLLDNHFTTVQLVANSQPECIPAGSSAVQGSTQVS